MNDKQRAKTMHVALNILDFEYKRKNWVFYVFSEGLEHFLNLKKCTKFFRKNMTIFMSPLFEE